MNAKRVVIELLPTRIDVVVCAGSKRREGRRLAIRSGPEGPGWVSKPEQAGRLLAPIVEELGAEGASAVVLYRSQSQAVGLTSLAARPAEVCEAARLECADSLTQSGAEVVCASFLAGADSAGEKRQHAVAAADRDEIIEAMATLVEHAGLKFAFAAPLNAITFSQLITEVLRDKSPRSCRLYVGDQGSFFVVAERGTLVFARQVGIGIDAVVTSMTRPLRRRDDTLQLDEARAQRILFEHGFPDRQQIVDEELGLTGAEIVPLMQTALQRFVVEMRQSVRFGLSDEQREDLRLVLSGPGSVLPGLDELLGKELGVTVERAGNRPASCDWSTPAGAGTELADILAARSVSTRFQLRPNEVTRHRNTRRLVRWLWTGAAAAIVVIAIDGVRYHLRLEDVSKQAAALAARDSGEEVLRETRMRMLGVVQAMSNLDRSVATEMGGQPGYRAIMQTLGRATPDSIRLSAIRINRDGGRAEISLHGFAFPDGEGHASRRTDLEPFIEALRASPMIESVELEGVQMVAVASRGCQQFRATMRTVSVPPPEDTAPALADAATEAAP